MNVMWLWMTVDLCGGQSKSPWKCHQFLRFIINPSLDSHFPRRLTISNIFYGFWESRSHERWLMLFEKRRWSVSPTISLRILRFENAFSDLFLKLCHKDGLFIKKKKKKTQQNEVWIEPILRLMLLSKFVFFLRQGHNFEHNYSPVSQHW